MSPQLDLSKWLNTVEVCAHLGISDATLEREVRAGRWQTRLRPRPGKRAERVFPPHEVEARIQKPPTELVRHEPVPSTPSGMTGLREMPEVTWPAIISLIESVISAKPAEAPKLWVKLKEASEITGLSPTVLKRLIKARKLDAIDDTWIKVRRAGLEELNLTAVLMKPGKKARKAESPKGRAR